MRSFFVDLFDDGYGVWEGRSIFYGWRLLILKTTDRAVMPLSRASLAGWQKAVPGKMRMSVTEDTALQHADELLTMGEVWAALAVALQLDCYFRPSEVLGLTHSQVLPPAPSAGGRYGKLWGLVLCPQEQGTRTKTGLVDDSKLVGDVAHAWLGKALSLVYDPSNYFMDAFEEEKRRLEDAAREVIRFVDRPLQ